MRLIVKICVLGSLAWSIYWLAAAFGLRGGVSAWFDAQRSTGWQADYATLETAGYPLRHETRLRQPALADPATGVAWQADSLSFVSPAWWPGNVTVAFPETQQRVSYFDQNLALTTRDTFADLHLKPGAQLEVEVMSLHSGPWEVSTDAGSLAGAEDLIISARQTNNPAQYKIDVSADQFRPGDLPRLAMRLPQSWPVQFETLALDMTVTFDGPWDRSALEKARPQPREINLKLAEIAWGELRLFAAGQVIVDEFGIPTGKVDIKADNWRDMLELAENSGTLAPSVRRASEQTLSLLAGLSGNPEALDLALTLRDGLVTLGPIPIGPAPRLFLR
ncbi:MAG: DUF2125 domain-containing protein [Paracoccaceae bacterium]